MDWASSQWKESLSSVAIQKVNALEDKIEKLQKERQQKQLQLECLELTLNKEKRKVEEEKQRTVHLERELQSLSDVCKNFESKQQKLQIEIQNRDSRLNNLEQQLSQAKKQCSRFQQFENDIEELKSLRDNSKIENKELEEKLKKEQSITEKQSDAISNLEQTIRHLQEKCSNSESSLLIDFDKENVNILNEKGNDNTSKVENLKKKILEQENIITELRTRITNIPKSSDNFSVSSSDVFSTPIKKSVTTESPFTSVKKAYSFWDNFGSTPSKDAKITKQLNESSTFNIENDEKVRTLQLKLKQLNQELECQRHNSEAAKNAMEQRLKEKENALKSEVKHQAQTISDMDKELQELKNKYQHDVIQGSKKLDIVNMQLQKSEISKEQMMKDLKTLELQINSNCIISQQKDDELKDLQKQKNSVEATMKCLQSENRELEKNCAGFQNQNRMLSEEVQDLKVQLDDRNNLVKEKEIFIQNIKKEQNNALKINTDLQMKIQTINKDLSALQSENNKLDKQLQVLSSNFAEAMRNTEMLTAEKKSISDLLNLEKCKLSKMEQELNEKSIKVSALLSEIKSNEESLMSFKTEIEDLKNTNNELKKSLTNINAENSSFRNQLNDIISKEASANMNVDKLDKENKEMSNLLMSIKCEKEAAESKVEEFNSKMALLQSNIDTKSNEINILKKDLVSSQEEFEKLKKSVNDINAENSSLKNQLNDIASKEASANINLDKLDKENKEMSNLLMSIKCEKEAAESKIEEFMAKLELLHSDNDTKTKEINILKKDLVCSQEEFQKLMKSNADTSAENSSLRNQLNDIISEEAAANMNLEKLDRENKEMSNLLMSIKGAKEAAEYKIEEFISKLELLQSDNDTKSKEINTLKKDLVCSREEFEKLLKSNADTEAKNSSLRNQLNDITSKEASASMKLDELDKENKERSNLLMSIRCEKEAAESKVEEFKSKLELLQSDNDTKTEEINMLKNDLLSSQEEFEKLKKSVANIDAENSSLRNQLNDISTNEALANTNLDKLDKENKEMSNLLMSIKCEKEAAESNVEEFKSKLELLQSDNDTKTKEINMLKNDLLSSQEEFEKLKKSVANIDAENSSLRNQLNDISTKEALANTNLDKLGKENKEMSNLLMSIKCEKEAAESNVEEFKSKLELLQSDNDTKTKEINMLKNDLLSSQEEFEKLKKSVANIDAENSSLRNQLNDISTKEALANTNLDKLGKENKEMSNLLMSIKCEKEAAESNVEEFKSKLELLQSDNDTKTKEINMLKNDLLSSQEEFEKLKKSVANIDAENSSLRNQLNDISTKEALANTNLDKLGKENKEMSNLLMSIKCEKEAAESNVEEFKSKLELLQSDNDTKTKEINMLKNDLLSSQEEFEKLKKSVANIDAENSSLRNQLNDISTKEALAKSNLDKLDKENKEMSNFLMSIKCEKEATESNVEEFKSKLELLQSDNDTKTKEINMLKNDMVSSQEEFEIKLKEIEETMSVIKSENKNLSNQMKDYELKENLLKEKVEAINVEKDNISDMFSAEIAKTQMFESNIKKMKTEILNLKSEIKSKDEAFCSLTKNIENLKQDHSEENINFTYQIESVGSTISSVQDGMIKALEKTASMEKEILGSSTEYKKYLKKDATKQNVQMDIFYDLLKHLDSVEQLTDFMSKNYEEKIMELEYLYTTEKSERFTIQHKLEVLNSFLESQENSFQRTTENMKLKDEKIAFLISCEEELKTTISDLLIEITIKNEHIKLLQSELEISKDANEKEKINFSIHIESALSSVLSVQDELKRVFNKAEVIENEMLTINKELREYLLKGANDHDVKIKYLSGFLKQLDSIEKLIDVTSKNYEDKITNLEQYYNVAQAKICTIQHQLELLNSSSAVQQNSLEKAEDDMKLKEKRISLLTSNEERLKENISNLLIELSTKEEYIDHLLVNIKTSKDITEEEKAAFITYVHNIESKLKPIKEGFYDVYVMSGLIENEINSLKGDYEDLLTSDMEKEECYKKLLDVINSIENETEVLINNHKNDICTLEMQLSQVNTEYSNLNSQFNVLLSEKIILENKLLISQKENKKMQENLADAKEMQSIIDIQMKEIEVLHVRNLEMVHVYEQQISNLKELHKNNIYSLEMQLSQASSKYSELNARFDVLSENTISLQQNRIDTTEMKRTVDILIKEIEMLYVRNLEMARVYEQQISDLKEQSKMQVSSLSHELQTAELNLTIVESKFKNIISRYPHTIFFIEKFHEGTMETSKDFHLSEHDQCYSSNNLEYRKGISKISHLLLHNMDSFENYFIQQNTVEIPFEVSKFINEQYQRNGMDENGMLTTNNDKKSFFSSLNDKQVIATNHQAEIMHFSIKLWNRLCTMEEILLNEKQYYKFLVNHRLVDKIDLKQIYFAYIMLKNIYKQVCLDLLILDPLRYPQNYLLLSQNNLTEKISHIANLFSNSSNNETLFFEKCLQVDSYKNAYLVFKLKRTLHFINEQLNNNFAKFEKLATNFFKYQNIHSSDSHIPTTVSSDYIIYMHYMNRSYSKQETYNFANDYEIKQVLCNLLRIPDISSHKLPFILNSVFKLSVCLFSSSADSALKNVINFIIENLISAYRKKVPCHSDETVRNCKNFILFISKRNSEQLKNNFIYYWQTLGNIIFSLFEKLSLKYSPLNNGYSSSDNKKKLDEATKEIFRLKQELKALQGLLTEEKEKLRDLEMYMGNVEKNGNVIVSQNENLKAIIVEFSKISSALKLVFSDMCDTSKLQSVISDLSDNLCLCYNCLLKNMNFHVDENHVLFTPMIMIHHVAELFISKVKFKKELEDLKANEYALKNEIETQVQEKTDLSQTLCNLEKEKYLVDKEVETMQSKNALLNKEYQDINLLLLELNNKQEVYMKLIEDNKAEINRCNAEYQEILSESKKLKNDILLKESKISYFEKIFDEKMSESETLTRKCNEYEFEINKLNDVIAKQLSEVKESKDNSSEAITSNIIELEEKITALENSKYLLNITVENVEAELQNLFTEKQNVEDMLKVKLTEIDNLKQEITVWKYKVKEKENNVSSLESCINELKESIADHDKRYTELLSINSALKNDIAVFNCKEKEHQVVLLQKDFCLKQKDLMITQLNKKISENLQEKANLENSIAEIKESLRNELEQNLVCNLQTNSDIALKEKNELEKQINDLSKVNKLMSECQSEIKIKYDELKSENNLLKEELHKSVQDMVKLEKKLRDQIYSAELNIKEMQKELSSEKKKNEESVKLENFLQETLKKEEDRNNASTLVIEELKRKYNELEKEMLEKNLLSKNRIDELSCENCVLQEQIIALNNQDNHIHECKDDSLSVTDYKLFIRKINTLLFDVISNVECNDDDGKFKEELLFTLTNWTHAEHSLPPIKGYENLQSFLKSQFYKQKELKLQICDLAKSICDSISQIAKYCDLLDCKYKPPLPQMNLSCLDITILGVSEETTINFSASNLIGELNKGLKLLGHCFDSLKYEINNMTMKIKFLQNDLDKAKEKPEEFHNGKQIADVVSLQNKITLLKSNGYRLEKKHNKLLQTCEGMEAKIKQLEEEKLELEAEANELAEEIKQKNISDECYESYITLSKANEELRQVKEENRLLKSAFNQWKEQSLISSNICNTSTDQVASNNSYTPYNTKRS